MYVQRINKSFHDSTQLYAPLPRGVARCEWICCRIKCDNNLLLEKYRERFSVKRRHWVKPAFMTTVIYVARIWISMCVPELNYGAGLLLDERARSRKWESRLRSPRRSDSIERKGKKSFRQTRIPEASSLQGSRINDLSVRWFFEFSRTRYS